jgi:hypothetical protein
MRRSYRAWLDRSRRPCCLPHKCCRPRRCSRTHSPFVSLASCHPRRKAPAHCARSAACRGCKSLGPLLRLLLPRHLGPCRRCRHYYRRRPRWSLRSHRRNPPRRRRSRKLDPRCRRWPGRSHDWSRYSSRRRDTRPRLEPRADEDSRQNATRFERATSNVPRFQTLTIAASRIPCSAERRRNPPSTHTVFSGILLRQSLRSSSKMRDKRRCSCKNAP